MCLGVLASFPASPARVGEAVWGGGGRGLAFMTAPGPDGQERLAPSFVTCLHFWDLTWPGCPTPDEARRTGAAAVVVVVVVVGGGAAKTNKRRQKHNMLVNKRIRRAGQGEIAFPAGVT